ncbi:MAG: SDR family NAD(P)-dependent oxidoreductase, partial [Candidatus Omnitrophica bacterium]|nr:SDR family NAD(P)-dependent oxidoreductase [Candidatus Omnitrophota bacterium]
MAKVLVLGASGYIGTKCVGRLLEEGFSVVAAARNFAKLSATPWAGHQKVKLLQVDVRSRDNLQKACAGCTAVYYFVHSMDAQSKDFAKTDRMAAENMKKAAYETGINRIIYLGGLGEAKSHLSRHLRSRMEVSEILHSGHVPVTTLRAAMIIGRGSISFEIMRYIVEYLPMIISSRWLETESQPIAIDNVLNYLLG